MIDMNDPKNLKDYSLLALQEFNDQLEESNQKTGSIYKTLEEVGHEEKHFEPIIKYLVKLGLIKKVFLEPNDYQITDHGYATIPLIRAIISQAEDEEEEY